MLPSAIFLAQRWASPLQVGSNAATSWVFFCDGDKSLGGGEGRRTLEATTATSQEVDENKCQKICPNSPENHFSYEGFPWTYAQFSEGNPKFPHLSIPDVEQENRKDVFFLQQRVWFSFEAFQTYIFLAR